MLGLTQTLGNQLSQKKVKSTFSPEHPRFLARQSKLLLDKGSRHLMNQKTLLSLK